MNKDQQSEGRKENAARPDSEAVSPANGGRDAVEQQTFAPGNKAPDPNAIGSGAGGSGNVLGKD
jgi:hypothetical protein